MSEMVEQVARASFKCWRDHMDSLGYHMDRGRTFETMGDSEREFALMNARAMITAMRKPSGDMLQALIAERERADIVCGVRWEKATVLTIWQAGVDAALGEE